MRKKVEFSLIQIEGKPEGKSEVRIEVRFEVGFELRIEVRIQFDARRAVYRARGHCLISQVLGTVQISKVQVSASSVGYSETARVIARSALHVL